MSPVGDEPEGFLGPGRKIERMISRMKVFIKNPVSYQIKGNILSRVFKILAAGNIYAGLLQFKDLLTGGS
jgi:hypothetical protein